jgi:HSP20 family protein
MARNALTPFGYGAADPIFSLHREMNRLFDDAFRSDGLPAQRTQGGTANFFNASMNVSETDKEIRIAVELPGVKPDDVDISLNGEVLTVRGEKRFEADNGKDKENYHYMERAYGTFQRSLRLPFSVRPEEVSADFEHGVLTISIPKSAQQEQSKKIPIGRKAQTAPSQEAPEAGSNSPPQVETPPPMH